ncbi:hypothetical protein M0R45_016282 [Rubus argutus]|uniref:Uncharacterized protein n=1 Tax=Rubus argutus TaxID=59490 RepID=A0AAW1XT59_RUBAR
MPMSLSLCPDFHFSVVAADIHRFCPRALLHSIRHSQNATALTGDPSFAAANYRCVFLATPRHHNADRTRRF